MESNSTDDEINHPTLRSSEFLFELLIPIIAFLIFERYQLEGGIKCLFVWVWSMAKLALSIFSVIFVAIALHLRNDNLFRVYLIFVVTQFFVMSLYIYSEREKFFPLNFQTQHSEQTPSSNHVSDDSGSDNVITRIITMYMNLPEDYRFQLQFWFIMFLIHIAFYIIARSNGIVLPISDSFLIVPMSFFFIFALVTFLLRPDDKNILRMSKFQILKYVDKLRLQIAERHYDKKEYKRAWTIFSEIDSCKFGPKYYSNKARNIFKFTAKFWITIYILEGREYFEEGWNLLLEVSKAEYSYDAKY
ncbi:27271_t:CDS:2 [Dentiscutata erythropus]|uniref:27271_t:CDS:1 n=1 Tax=Dentiscutata erythropus TaxID=1348616 RepID=A0A9N8YT17_9GLOM|nr:27271_t:CDS:2 [Dentiscutata erythropus]